MNEENAAHAYAGYDAARTGVAAGHRGHRGWIRVRGADGVSFLHGILTNDVASLVPGTWRYAAYLTPQGRMISDMRVLRREDDVVLETEPHVAEALARRFDASIFTEQVQIALGDAWARPTRALDTAPAQAPASVVVCGPGAPEALASVLAGGADIVPSDPHAFTRTDRQQDRLILIKHGDLGVPAVDVIGSGAACEGLVSDLQATGAAVLGPLALEALRVEAGTPRFGVDMTEDTIPLEAGIEGRAISFTKGCYVGQEVIIRILHRGHGRVARRLVGLSIDGHDVPSPGSPLSAEGRDVGLITSAVFSPRLGRAIALGYVHRDLSAAGTTVAVQPVGTPAIVTDLPFMKR